MEDRLNFTEEFSRYPGGRHREHGPRSGQEFRENILEPRLLAADKLIIDLSNAAGFPSSFLDEAFGELGKKYGLNWMKSKLEVTCEDDPNLVALVWEKIETGAEEHDD